MVRESVKIILLSRINYHPIRREIRLGPTARIGSPATPGSMVYGPAEAVASKLIFTLDVRKSGSADIFHPMSRDTGSTLHYDGIGENRGVARCRSVCRPGAEDALLGLAEWSPSL